MFEGLGKVAAYGGKNMKNNKIRIYQCFLSLRIFFIFAATCLFIDIIMNIKNILVDAKIWELFLYLIIVIVAPILLFYSSIYLDK